MALKDNAVLTAAVGYVFTAAVGTAAPSPSVIDTLDPVTFGSQVNDVKLASGTASGGTYTITVGADTTDPIAWNASAAAVQAELEALESVGAGNVVVTGTSLTSPGFSVAFVGDLQGETVTVSVEDASLTGTTPVLETTTTTALNGWSNLGHTSRDDMPEFAFDGGDTEVKGTWQKKRLREVATGDPVADSVTLNLQQWDVESLEMYFGANSSATPGVFGVSGEFTPIEKAMLIVIVDGDVRVAFYAPKASLKRDDSIDMPVDEFASFPVKATFLNYANADIYQWISLDLFS